MNMVISTRSHKRKELHTTARPTDRQHRFRLLGVPLLEANARGHLGANAHQHALGRNAQLGSIDGRQKDGNRTAVLEANGQPASGRIPRNALRPAANLGGAHVDAAQIGDGQRLLGRGRIGKQLLFDEAEAVDQLLVGGDEQQESTAR